eukprot:UC4_evm2s363
MAHSLPYGGRFPGMLCHDEWRPLSKRWHPPDSPFFDEGNAARSGLNFDIETHEVTACTASVSNVQEDQENRFPDTKNYQCRVVNPSTKLGVTCFSPFCGLVFPNTAEAEAHYNLTHRNRCRVCGSTFATARILELHLSEVHDPVFSVRAEKLAITQRDDFLDPSLFLYECLVDSCDARFRCSAERKVHLHEVHKFPLDFPVEAIITGNHDGNRMSKGRKKLRAVDEDGDEVMGALINSMANVSVGVPKSLSFGRRGRGSGLFVPPVNKNAAPEGKKREKKKTMKRNVKSNFTCYICGERGHKQKNCPKRDNGDRGTNTTANNKFTLLIPRSVSRSVQLNDNAKLDVKFEAT